MDSIKEIFVEVLKRGLMLEFKSDEGRVNWGVATAASLITVVYIISQTKIAGYYAQYLHKEYPIIGFGMAFKPTAIIASACLLLMFIVAFIRIKAEIKSAQKNKSKKK